MTTRTDQSRMLTEPDSGKLWQGILTGKSIQFTTGTPEKLRKREKSFDTVDAAHTNLMKTQWTKLKAGYVLCNPQATPSEPVLHTYLGGSYTGMLPLAASDKHIFCCRFSDANDTLLTMDDAGGTHQSTVIPGQRLVFDMMFAPDLGLLFLNADHGVLAWNPESPGEFHSISEMNQYPASCLSVGGTRVVVFEHEHSRFVVKEALGGQSVLELPRTPELVGGHTPQMAAALNRAGELLATCSQSGEVELFDIESNKQVAKMLGDFRLIENLEFIANGKWLVGLSELEGPIFFDISAQKLVDSPFPLPPLQSGAVHIAMDANKPRFALASDGDIHIYNTNSLQCTQTIHFENFSKGAKICFIGERIVVRTDLACLSAYALLAA